VSARPNAAFVARLFESSRAAEWELTAEAFAAAIETSVAKGLAGREASPADVERYVQALHIDDLALAAACAAGGGRAWDHFIREYRPVLYRAADAIDPTGSARELADSLYGELYGLGSQKGARASLFRYFHGRSSLATWLRAVLAQRVVDQRRAARRLEPLPAEELLAPARSRSDPDGPARSGRLRAAFLAAAAALAPRDRLRLALYYVHDLTLAAIGKQFGEHEATVSRQLARTRRGLKDDVERRLRTDYGMDDAAIDECWHEGMSDAGSLDLGVLVAAERKNTRPDRSKEEDEV
jgi:RNA polymerase sigma-70 factor